MNELIARFEEAIGSASVVTGAALEKRATSYWNASPTLAKALLRPASTEEVSRVMQICHENEQSVVVQGGLTGVVSGAVSTEADVIITLEKMTAIETVDEIGGTAVIQAGAILQSVQERMAERGFLFPLDLGARGSCTLGGTVATNAGGINVLRYGMMRNLVLGLETVLADGTVISSMNQMLKNNTGYDLKQLFIGSEGTLGVVTRMVVRLFPMPGSCQTAMVALESFDAVIKLLKTMQSELAGTLSAFEVMWNHYFRAVTVEGTHRPPLDRDYSFYVIMEAEGSHPKADEERFNCSLENAFEEGVIVDAVIPKSDSEREELWNIREEFDPVLPAYLYDVSLPIRVMDEYVQLLDSALRERWPEVDFDVFGHIADGNLHLFVQTNEEGDHHAECDEIVYGCLEGFEGSVSAEHGIGIEKKQWLKASRSLEEIELMRSLKQLLDPANLLNPGKLFDQA
jgi:FAD/FMN-containing dehydrogenase